MRTVVIATNNAHKADEIASALAVEGWEFATLAQAGLASDPEEDAGTFEGNARIKAQAAWEAARAAGMRCAVLADDSGLEVDALGGEPGVYSARYAGPEADDAANNAKLLAALEAVPDAERTARFACTLVMLDEEGAETVARGTVEGRIGREPRGAEGFGYDPLFRPDAFADGRTLAEVPQAEKAAVSHRGNALRVLGEALGL